MFSTQIHMELKCGVIKKNILRYSLRPEQRREILAMKDDGVPVGIVVGIKSSNSVMFFRPVPEALNGEFSLLGRGMDAHYYHAEVSDPRDFWLGTRFIFNGA